MYMIWTHISADYIDIIGRANLPYYLSIHLSAILPYNTLYLYFVQNTMWYSMSYTLCELLLYVMPHMVLKYSPKGEGFHPSHVLEINN